MPHKEILKSLRDEFRYSLVSNLTPKTNHLAEALENSTESAIKLSINVIFYSILLNCLKNEIYETYDEVMKFMT